MSTRLYSKSKVICSFHEHCMINVRLLQCCVSEQTADEAGVSENFFLVLLLTAEVSERVDNDAEN